MERTWLFPVSSISYPLSGIDPRFTHTPLAFVRTHERGHAGHVACSDGDVACDLDAAGAHELTVAAVDAWTAHSDIDPDRAASMRGVARRSMLDDTCGP